MSILTSTSLGWLISHEKLINEIYRDVNNSQEHYRIKNDLFNITTPYKQPRTSRKTPPENDLSEEVKVVRTSFSLFVAQIGGNKDSSEARQEAGNKAALELAELLYSESGKTPLITVQGHNQNGVVKKQIAGVNVLFPQNCEFFCQDVKDFSRTLGERKFDLILLDPPWWNKYIRRKRKHSYNMLYNSDLRSVPLERYLKPDGLIVVWCTNSPQNFKDLTSIFDKWGVKLAATWYWVKVTNNLEPICPFSPPPRKQPFERIVIGGRRAVPDGKLVVSTPSALHSHKPPLMEILQEFLPVAPDCLEVFARYLLPGWSSYGNEVLRFQEEIFFEKGD